MPGRKEICGLVFLFGWHSLALTDPISKEAYLTAIKHRAEKLLKTFKGNTFNENLLKAKNLTVRTTFPEGLPNCSQNTHSDLAFVKAFNSLLNEFVNGSDRCLTEAVKIELRNVIKQQAALLNTYHTKSKIDLIKHFEMPSDDIDRMAIYFYVFQSFKTCMDQLTRTSA